MKRFTDPAWTTMADFGLSVNHIPANEISLVEEAAHPIRDKAVIRCLFFEPCTMAAHDIARRASQPDGDDKPKKLPLAGMSERIQKIQVNSWDSHCKVK